MDTNAVEENQCVMCGFPLIEPNDWYCCKECEPKMKEKILKARKNTGPRSPKRIVISAPKQTAWLRNKK